MWCLVPGAAAGESLRARGIYQRLRGGQEGRCVSRKEFVFPSRFSIDVKKGRKKIGLKTDFENFELSRLIVQHWKNKNHPKAHGYLRSQFPSSIGYVDLNTCSLECAWPWRVPFNWTVTQKRMTGECYFFLWATPGSY